MFIVVNCVMLNANTMAQKTILSPELQAIEREYGRNIRIVETRPMIERFAVFAACLVEGASLAFFFIIVLGFIISGSFSDIRSAGVSFGANIQNAHAIAAQHDAKAFVIGSSKILQGTPSTYDFFTTITNPNADWYATFTYTFSSSSVSSESRQGFVMPGETSYLLALGNKVESRPGAVSVALNDVVWHRVYRHVAPDISTWLRDHNAFVISAPEYALDVTFAEAKIGRSTFAVTNTTPYAYWVAPFTVVLERAGSIVGITQATVTEFESGEIRDVDVRWYEDVPISASVTVMPAINYFDQNVYMPPRGVSREDVRDTISQ
jgi:hypothetical protein